MERAKKRYYKNKKIAGVPFSRISRDMREAILQDKFQRSIPGVGAYSPRFDSIEYKLKKMHEREKSILSNLENSQKKLRYKRFQLN